MRGGEAARGREMEEAMEEVLRRKMWSVALSVALLLGGGVALGAASSAADAQPAYAAQKKGWVQSGNRWWYAHEGSGYATGWESVGGTWYHFDADGWMNTGWLNDRGTWYYLRGSGAMATGWQQVGSSWYWLKGSGAMATGWLPVGKKWYYLKPSGAMATGWYTVDGEWNWSDSNGVWRANEWVKDSRGWWYAWADGTYPHSSWQKIDGNWYYFDANGYMMADCWVGDYWLEYTGAMATCKWVGYGGCDYVGFDGRWIPDPQDSDFPVVEVNVSDFEYEVRGDGVHVSWSDSNMPFSNFEGRIFHVVIPETIEGKPVVSFYSSLLGDRAQYDFSKVAKNIKEVKFLSAINPLRIDLSNCTSLETLNMDYCRIASLNLSGCTALSEVRCSNASLASLDLSDCTSLRKLYCSNSGLSSIKLASQRLYMLSCPDNNLTSIDLSKVKFSHMGPGCPEIDISNNRLTALDVNRLKVSNDWCMRISLACSGNDFDARTKAAIRAWGESEDNRLDW